MQVTVVLEGEAQQTVEKATKAVLIAPLDEEAALAIVDAALRWAIETIDRA